MEIIEKIAIKSAPDRIWDALVFFFQNSDNYKLWHKDHVSCYWKKGKDFKPGSVLIAEEYLSGQRHKLGFKIRIFDRDNLLKYKMQFPFSIICSGGYFKLVRKNDETEFVAQLNFRPGLLFKIFFKDRLEGMRRHMQEEGQNIKEFIEK